MDNNTDSNDCELEILQIISQKPHTMRQLQKVSDIAHDKVATLARGMAMGMGVAMGMGMG